MVLKLAGRLRGKARPNPFSSLPPQGGGLWTKTLIALLLLALGGVLFYQLRQIITAVLLAFAIAYFFSPLIDRLVGMGAKRSRAIVLVLLLILMASIAFVLFLAPLLISQLSEFVELLPQKLHRLYAWADIYLNARFGVQLPSSAAEWFEELRLYVSANQQNLARPLAGILQGTITGTVGAILAFLNLLLIPILSVYLMFDFKNIVRRLRELVPPRYLPRIESYSAQLDGILASFFRGQLTLVLVLSAFYSFGFIWVNFPLAIFVGILSGFCHLIPYLGPLTAGAIGLIMILADFNDFWQLGKFALVLATVQGLESFVLTPRLVGKRVGLSTVTTILALLVFGKLFGFIGLLLAIPLAAISKLLLIDARAWYLQSRFYNR